MTDTVPFTLPFPKHWRAISALVFGVGQVTAAPLVYGGFNYGENTVPIDGIEAGGGATGIVSVYSSVADVVVVFTPHAP